MARKPKQTTKVQPKQTSYSGWVPKVTRSTILVCSSCKMKYIKTREPQLTCFKCALTPIKETVFRLRKDS